MPGENGDNVTLRDLVAVTTVGAFPILIVGQQPHGRTGHVEGAEQRGPGGGGLPRRTRGHSRQRVPHPGFGHARIQTSVGTCEWQLRNVLFQGTQSGISLQVGDTAPASITGLARNVIFTAPLETEIAPGSSAAFTIGSSSLPAVGPGFIDEGNNTTLAGGVRRRREH